MLLRLMDEGNTDDVIKIVDSELKTTKVISLLCVTRTVESKKMKHIPPQTGDMKRLVRRDTVVEIVDECKDSDIGKFDVKKSELAYAIDKMTQFEELLAN